MSERSEGSTSSAGTRPVVLVGVGGTEDGERALRYAVLEAHRREARLRILHSRHPHAVIAPMAEFVPERAVQDVADRIVDRAQEVARVHGFVQPDVECLLADPPVHAALLAHARDVACVVLGRRSSSMRHLVTGSTTAALAALAPAPLVAVPASWDPEHTHGKVVVGIDGAGDAWPVVETALEEAARRRARLEVVHAWRPWTQYDEALDTRAVARTWTRSTRMSLGRWMHDHHPDPAVEWTVEPRYQRPAQALHEESRTADVLVVGRHGRTALHGLTPGSVTRTLLRVSECPVLVVPLPPPTSAGAETEPADSDVVPV